MTAPTTQIVTLAGRNPAMVALFLSSGLQQAVTQAQAGTITGDALNEVIKGLAVAATLHEQGLLVYLPEYRETVSRAIELGIVQPHPERGLVPRSGPVTFPRPTHPAPETAQ